MDERGTSAANYVQQANELKAQGNDLYQKGDFEAALAKYQRAEQVNPLDAVFPSNASAVLFELGRYVECIEFIDRSLKFAVATKNKTLPPKLLQRKAKCCLYLDQINEGLEVIQHSKDYNPTITGELLVLQQIFAMKQKKSTQTAYKTLPKIRPCLKTSALEYYVVGTDMATSAFAGMVYQTEENPLQDMMYPPDKPPTSREEGESQQMKDKRATMGDVSYRINVTTSKTPISVYYGGIGDARHLFATIIDAGIQIKRAQGRNNNNNSTSFKTTTIIPQPVHFTMLDIKAAAIARDLILFYAIDRLAQLQPFKNPKNQAVIETVVLLEYLYTGELMPKYSYDLLLRLIRELQDKLNSKSLPPWLIVQSPTTITEVLKIFNHWLKPPPYTVKHFIDKVKERKQFGNPVTDEILRNSGNMPEGSLDMMNGNHLASLFNHITDEQLMEMPVPKGKTLEERRAIMKSMMTDSSLFSAMGNLSMLPSPSLRDEFIFYTTHHFIPPPVDMKDKHKGLAPIAWQPMGKEQGKFAKKDVEQFRKHMNEDWQLNPTFLDKEWNEDIGLMPQDHEPLVMVSNLYSVVLDMSMEADYYQMMFTYFATLAESLAQLISYSSARFEWQIGEVLDHFQDMEQTRQQRLNTGLPISYDRMFLSNIPDYIGGPLSVFTFGTPLLKPKALVSFNIMLNPN
eukprot:TRINITY_DN3399_c0_g1_i1.p1 TRINITY_DN3399_c0_g1~~TRINITY_DN3399_c0_g1_i1.p1  ORF type:complete len:683 (-),score=153.06 TRINITY_DN3399_c0_g1_i1:95-2143(-)